MLSQLARRSARAAARSNLRTACAAAVSSSSSSSGASLLLASAQKRAFASKSDDKDDNSHSDFAPKYHAAPSTEKDEILKMIDSHVKTYPVMLYMKGTPSAPQCGFSMQVVRILHGQGVSFDSVNVLDHPEIRDGVKEYSQWPTIPQLYVKGEFVGGCDIVTDMNKSGELSELLAEFKNVPEQMPILLMRLLVCFALRIRFICVASAHVRFAGAISPARIEKERLAQMVLAKDDEIDPLDAYMASLELPSTAPKASAGTPASPVVSAIDWATTRRGSRRKASDAQRAPDANDIGSSGAVVKNRRYRRLQQLLQGEKVAQDLSQPGAMEANPDDWYFSDAMMQQRNPALFHFHLGQYLPAAAAASSNTGTQLDSSGIDAEELLLSSFLLSTNDRREMEVRRAFEQRTWGKFTGQDEKDARARERALFQQDQEEEQEEESSSEEENDGGDEEMKQNERHEEAAENDVMSIAERRQLLVDLMVQRFLQGSDHQYVNYAEIDLNAALDDLEQMQRDAEDAYFDMEENE